MPLWLVIMVIGAAFCGWVFLKTREMEGKNTLKKVKEGHKDVKKAAQHAKGVYTETYIETQRETLSAEQVNMSEARPSIVAKQLEEILHNKGVE